MCRIDKIGSPIGIFKFLEISDLLNQNTNQIKHYLVLIDLIALGNYFYFKTIGMMRTTIGQIMEQGMSGTLFSDEFQHPPMYILHSPFSGAYIYI